MSHELRTPLNAIVGFSEMLEGQVLGPIGVRRYVDYAHDIRASGGRLLGQIERMLDLAEIEADRLTLATTIVDPADLLEQAVESVRSFAQAQHVNLVVMSCADAMLRMKGDAPRLRQAFTNVIHNAIKFTPAAGEVRVEAVVQNGHLSIRIVDHGIGMPQDLLDSVVRPFHRLRSALDGVHQGAGLGLPFAKAIVELHGGSLTLDSEVGGGTTVNIDLPTEHSAVSRAA